MSFEIVEPGRFAPADPLQEGQCSVSKAGKLTLRSADLDKVGVTHCAVVLADRGNLRIALRAVRDGEQQSSIAVTVIGNHKGKDTGRRSLSATRALGVPGVKPEAAAGRYDLAMHGDGPEALLIVNLAGDRVPMPEVRRIERRGQRREPTDRKAKR